MQLSDDEMDAMVPLTFAAQFNYFEETCPAKTDPTIEAAMVEKFFSLPENGGRFTREQCAAFVHHFVHIAKHHHVVAT